MRSEAWKDKLGRVTDEMTTEPASAHESGHKTLRSLSQQVLTTYRTTFCEISLPHTFPSLAAARKIRPSLTPAAAVH